MAADPTAISEGDILQHAEWVRRLALALVKNPDDADELAQETWEAALARPPREAGPLRPWLGGVARNLARMRARSSGPRCATRLEAHGTRLDVMFLNAGIVRFGSIADVDDALFDESHRRDPASPLRYARRGRVCGDSSAASYPSSASMWRWSSRAISAPTSAARAVNVSGPTAAHSTSWAWNAAAPARSPVPARASAP
jgi:DNA-directed RNA polymerase specialized sigma24 family protein